MTGTCYVKGPCIFKEDDKMQIIKQGNPYAYFIGSTLQTNACRAMLVTGVLLGFALARFARTLRAGALDDVLQ